ncbi:acyltransferase family protein [Fibrobacter sp. UWB7]|uniref:acyltransferase n=1 Tax=Fibrobacter sp. UWB7 TaxID=1896206 RepID=UPI00091B2DCF|nr:acyltransferase family protein [Fibrobacter sp. UWB7]SHM25777.1 Surface polysaccharide O-acyltransferase, integral membrane enzyme [Fibrobacter sp. UWB7]
MPSNEEISYSGLLPNNRILYPDILRILAVLAVMVLHVSASGFVANPIQSYAWQIANFYECLVRWSVPIFVMVSGMFFLNPQKEITLSKLYRKSIFRILVALIAWGVFYRSLSISKMIFIDKVCDAELATSILKQCSKFVFGHAWYHLWFLYMIIGLYMLVPLIRVFTIHATKKHYHYLFILYFLFGSLLPLFQDVLILFDDRLKISFSIKELMGYAGYFILGYYLFRYDLSHRIKKWIYVLAGLSVVFQILGTFFVSIKLGTASQLLYGNFRPNVVIQAVAVYVFVKDYFMNRNFSERTKSFIVLFSKYSFGMYLVHDFFNIIFSRIGFTPTVINPIIAIPLRSVVTFVLSFAVIWVLGHIPVIKKYCM